MSLAAETTTALVLLVVCATVANGRTVFNYSLGGNQENSEVQDGVDNLENFQSVLEEFGEENFDCSCNGLSCQCCQDVEVKKFKAKFCMLLTYKPSTGVIVAELKAGKQSIWKAEFPARRLPSPCVGMKGFKVCVDFQNVHIDTKALSGCVQLTLKGIGDIKINLGCFNIKFADSATEPAFLPLMRGMKM